MLQSDPPPGVWAAPVGDSFSQLEAQVQVRVVALWKPPAKIQPHHSTLCLHSMPREAYPLGAARCHRFDGTDLDFECN